MMFLVFEECTYKDGNHVSDCTNCRLEWLATVKHFQKKGKVVAHYDFKENKGGITVYETGSREELDQLLTEHPELECKMERRIHELVNLEEAIERFSHRIVTG